jgi:hemerythrin superfamily protein
MELAFKEDIYRTVPHVWAVCRSAPLQGEDAMAAPKPADAVEMLKADHQKVRGLFQQYATASGQPKRQQIAEQVLVELEVHAQLEENVFYPAYEAQAGKTGTQLVAEARQDHQTVKDLITELRALDGDNPEFAAKFQELVENVEHHVEEEETAMLPEAEEILAEQLEDLMDEMQELKQQLLAS